MLFRALLAILLGGVAASAVVFYVWEESIDEIIQKKKQLYLEDCLRRSYADNSTTND